MAQKSARSRKNSAAEAASLDNTALPASSESPSEIFSPRAPGEGRPAGPPPIVIAIANDHEPVRRNPDALGVAKRKHGDREVEDDSSEDDRGSY